VVITGTGSGFGAAAARLFADEGAAVVAADINPESGAAVAAEIEDAGGTIEFVKTDVSEERDIEQLVARAAERFGRIDVLINNAGLSNRMGSVLRAPAEDFDRLFAINVKSVFLGVKHAVPVMRRNDGGVVINTASIGAVAPRVGAALYNASKGAVITLTRALAVELAPTVRVCAVNPVAAETGFFGPAFGNAVLTEERRQSFISTIPMGRMCEPSDVAAAMAYLASDAARFLTGVCLDVDGGRSI
jgi:3-oxoacyl-[acyl-carrier protein] reductase